MKLLSETHTDFIDHFVDFNASKAKCHNENDRQRLLATIEASFALQRHSIGWCERSSTRRCLRES